MTSKAVLASHTVGIQVFEDWHFLSSQGGTEWSRPLGMEGRGHEGTGRWKVASVTDSLLTPSKPRHLISCP